MERWCVRLCKNCSRRGAVFGIYSSRATTRFVYMRKISQLILASLAFGAVFVSQPVQAQSLAQSQNNAALVAETAGIQQTDLVTIVGRIIYIFLSLLGTIFLVLMLYAGFIWMTAAGDPKRVDTAKSMIRNAIIGIVIITSAFFITNYILDALTNSGSFGGGGQSPSGPCANPPCGLVTSAGALGGGIIESHLPMRNALDVPRNTPIIITFKEPIKPESFIEGWTEANPGVEGLNSANVKIYPTENGPSAALPSDKARVKFLADRKTFVIKPVDYLGSPVKKTGYTIELKGGASGMKKMDGGSVFSGAFSSGYNWPFEVSTVVDLVPPKVIDVVPVASGKYPRNIVVQINFDRAMDPTSVSGKTGDGFMNIEALATPDGGNGLNPVSGTFEISNQYRTVEFMTEEKCGTNSCAQDVYCLPDNSSIQFAVKAATLAGPDSAQAELTSNGYNGVVSAVGNSLDGNKNGKGEGPPGDNYAWEFGTSGEIKLSPPRVEVTIPSSDQQSGDNSNIPLDQPAEARFDTRLRSATLNSINVKI